MARTWQEVKTEAMERGLLTEERLAAAQEVLAVRLAEDSD